MKTDKNFYTLFKAFPQLLFELTGQNTDLAQVYEFTSVEVKELAKSDRQSVGISILKFIASSQVQAPEQFPSLLEQVEQEIIEVPQKREVIELIEKIIIYKFPKKSRKELERMFNLTDWKKTQFYREVKQEGKEEGKEEGKLETIPLLLRLGLTAEQISSELGLDLDLVRQAINKNQDNN